MVVAGPAWELWSKILKHNHLHDVWFKHVYLGDLCAACMSFSQQGLCTFMAPSLLFVLMQMRSAIYEYANHHSTWIQALDEETVLFQTVLCGITEINLLTLWLLVRQIPSFRVGRGTVAPPHLILQSELTWAFDLHKASTEHSHQQTK